jgi:glycylpeptide N-tetradecanoyltransferase
LGGRQGRHKSPGFSSCLHLGIRHRRKLVAFISAISVNIQTPQGNCIKCSEVNFLCIHKSLRSKRLAPVLIREITRRSHLLGIHQGIYTAGARLSEPFALARYWHRPLNALKVLSTGFCNELPPEAIGDFLEMFSFEASISVCQKLSQKFHWRKACENDLEEMYELFCRYQQRFPLRPKFAMEEFKHWLLPRDKVLWNWVFFSVEKEEEIIGFYSVWCDSFFGFGSC